MRHKLHEKTKEVIANRISPIRYEGSFSVKKRSLGASNTKPANTINKVAHTFVLYPEGLKRKRKAYVSVNPLAITECLKTRNEQIANNPVTPANSIRQLKNQIREE